MKKAAPKAETKIKGKTIRSVTLFLDLVILGFAIGFVVSRFAEWDLFHRWHQLPDPPTAVSELLTVLPGKTGEDYTLYLQTTDERVYSCNQVSGECWIPAELPDPVDQPASDGDQPFLAGDISADCDAGSRFFAFMTNQPRQVSDCLQFRIEIKGGFTDAALALHPDGSLWGWSNSHSGEETVQNAVYAIGVGIAAGALVALVLIFIIQRRSPD